MTSCGKCPEKGSESCYSPLQVLLHKHGEVGDTHYIDPASKRIVGVNHAEGVSGLLGYGPLHTFHFSSHFVAMHAYHIASWCVQAVDPASVRELGGEMDGSLEAERAELEKGVTDYVSSQYVTENVRPSYVHATSSTYSSYLIITCPEEVYICGPDAVFSCRVGGVVCRRRARCTPVPAACLW